MDNIFYRFNYTILGSRILPVAKTIMIPECNVVRKLVDGTNIQMVVETKGLLAANRPVVVYGGVSSLISIKPQGDGSGNVLGGLLPLNATMINGIAKASPTLVYINPDNIISIEASGSGSVIHATSESVNVRASMFDIYFVTETLAQIKTAIENIPQPTAGVTPGGGIESVTGNLVDNTDSSNPVINNYILISHEDLRDLKLGSNLKPGVFYAIDDYKTIYDQPDFQSDGSPKATVLTKQASTGETLVLLATSSSTFENKVYSIEYPNDELEYDIDFIETEYMGRPAVGRITYRKDDDGNSADYDFRTVLLKRYESSTGSGVFNQWVDNGEAYEEYLTFGNSYGSALIKGNVIDGMRGLGYLFDYPFLICNIVIDATTSAIGNNISVISRNCTFGNGLTGSDLNSAYNCIVGTDMRNFKNTGNISNFRAGNNTNSIGFLTAVQNFTIGDNNTNIHFMHSISNVTIGSDNNNWTCENEITDITSDNDLSNINNLIISSYIDGSAWTNFITTITQPDMYNNVFRKEIFVGSDNNVYWRYFNGTNDVNTIIN